MAYVSPSCEYITGYSSDEFTRRPGLLDEIVDSLDREAWVAHRSGRSQRSKSESLRFRIQTKSGQSRWVEHACQPVQEDGVFLGFRVSNRDISERQAAHIERNALRTQIAHISRVTAMGELTAALAHEINQPLGAILSNAQAAVRFLGHAEPDMQEVRDALDAIVADDKRAGQIVRRLRRMVSAGTPEYEPTRMREVIDEVISLVRSELILNHVHLDKQMMNEVIEVACDRVQIQQVLLNLITNAIDSMKHVPRADRLLRIRMAREGDHHVTVSVKDRGAGMDAESIESVFRPFYTTKKTGMGMGLAISRSIIELHKGELGAEINPGNGMTFWFTVPLERSAE
jgi:PAS domain S-box-containing protein